MGHKHASPFNRRGSYKSHLALGAHTMGHKKPDILLIIAFVVVLGAVTGSFITDAAPDTRMAPQQAGILVQ